MFLQVLIVITGTQGTPPLCLNPAPGDPLLQLPGVISEIIVGKP